MSVKSQPRTALAVNRALSQPILIEKILHWISALPDLISCARVCQSLSWTASRVLWMIRVEEQVLKASICNHALDNILHKVPSVKEFHFRLARKYGHSGERAKCVFSRKRLQGLVKQAKQATAADAITDQPAAFLILQELDSISELLDIDMKSAKPPTTLHMIVHIDKEGSLDNYIKALNSKRLGAVHIFANPQLSPDFSTSLRTMAENGKAIRHFSYIVEPLIEIPLLVKDLRVVLGNWTDLETFGVNLLLKWEFDINSLDHFMRHSPRLRQLQLGKTIDNNNCEGCKYMMRNRRSPGVPPLRGSSPRHEAEQHQYQKFDMPAARARADAVWAARRLKRRNSGW